MFSGAVNAWRNASLDSAKYSMEIEIGDRKKWLLPAIGPRVGKFFNDWLARPAKTVVGLFTGTKAKDPDPMPELPEAFRGNALGEDLKKNYDQRCAKVIQSAKATQCMLNLDFTGMREAKSVAAHEDALNRISLPEDYQAPANVSTSNGTVVGNLVANAPHNSIRGKIRAALS